MLVAVLKPHVEKEQEHERIREEIYRYGQRICVTASMVWTDGMDFPRWVRSGLRNARFT